MQHKKEKPPQTHVRVTDKLTRWRQVCKTSRRCVFLLLFRLSSSDGEFTRRLVIGLCFQSNPPPHPHPTPCCVWSTLDFIRPATGTLHFHCSRNGLGDQFIASKTWFASSIFGRLNRMLTFRPQPKSIHRLRDSNQTNLTVQPQLYPAGCQLTSRYNVVPETSPTEGGLVSFWNHVTPP